MKRVCFLHIGTHKTGSTALQTFLSSNEQCLERNGILIPQGGRPWRGSGQHNLAWELSGDPRFDPAFGSWRDVLCEIRSHDPPTVCISSEDFLPLRLKPDSLCRIRQELNSIGYEVRVVVYLRPQADYLESVYAEMVRHGEHRGFRESFPGILLSRVIPPRDTRRGAFDYGPLLERFVKAFGQGCMVVRPYCANRESEYILNDFMSVISPGRRIGGLDFSACRERLNPSPSFAQVVELWLANRRKSRGEDSEPNTSSIPDGDFMHGRFDPLDLRDLIRIHRRFYYSNRALRKTYQVKIPTMTWPRLREELKCAMGLNPESARRKALLAQLEAYDKLPWAAVSG
jgi:hypothetical protein